MNDPQSLALHEAEPAPSPPDHDGPQRSTARGPVPPAVTGGARADADLYAEGQRIARGLLEATWPATRFHHREHCLATACLILEQPEVAWETELPTVIRRYNLAMGGTNTDDTGYHDTLTQFFLGEIRAFLAAHAALAPAERCRALLGSPIASKDHALRFYTRERLESRAARRTWLPPDRAPAGTRSVVI